jgi:hypothetical protein
MTTRLSYASIQRVLTNRLGVFSTRMSVLRTTAWVVVCFLGLSYVFAPKAPSRFDRPYDVDLVPSANVRYVAPLSRADFAGFLVPPPQGDEFTVAWVGGSEVKLHGVSVPADVLQRVTSVGGRTLVINAYSINAMRVLDTYRAALTAIDNGANALVVALNPAFVTDEWSMSEWRNLDVSDSEVLLRDRRTLNWFFALTSPGDVAWRVTKRVSPVIQSRMRANEIQQSWVHHLDILRAPDPTKVKAPPPDPRLPPDSTSFWLLHESGTAAGEKVETRIRGIVDGFGVGEAQSTAIVEALIDAGGRAGIPVYLYITPLSPAFIADPAYRATADKVEAHWRAIAAKPHAANVFLETNMLSRDLPKNVAYLDPIHMADAQPLADLFANRLCAQWKSFSPKLECTHEP